MPGSGRARRPRVGVLGTTSRIISADDDDGYGLNGSGEIALATATGRARDFARAGAEVGSTGGVIALRPQGDQMQSGGFAIEIRMLA